MKGGIYLLLGTNLGDKRLNLKRARDKISRHSSILRTSAIYQSKAWGKTDQPEFYNQVIEIDTSLSSEDLLIRLLSAEEEMGRKRIEKWGPRLIDIDILLYRQDVVNLPQLTVPHPEIANRRFTLLPLYELAPGLMHPVLQKKVSELLQACPDLLEVTPLL